MHEVRAELKMGIQNVYGDCGTDETQDVSVTVLLMNDKLKCHVISISQYFQLCDMCRSIVGQCMLYVCL